MENLYVRTPDGRVLPFLSIFWRASIGFKKTSGYEKTEFEVTALAHFLDILFGGAPE